MAYRFGKAFIDITANSSPLKRVLAGTHTFMRGFVGFGVNILGGMFRRLIGILSGIVKSLMNIVKWAGLAATALYVLALRATVKQEQSEIKLGAAIRATGYAAGFTLQQLKKYAAELQKVTRHGDEALMPIMGMLATFKEIRGPIFKRAMEAILDMAAVMEMDLRSAAIMTGKALNDPVKGLTALSRTGVIFTGQAIKTIHAMMEMGDIIGAQNVMLKEMEGQFKGVERAMAKTAGGALRRLKNEFMDLMELFAKPALKPLMIEAEKLIAWMRSASVRDAVYSWGTRFHIALGGIKDAFVDLYKYLKSDWLGGFNFIGDRIVDLFGTVGRMIGNSLYAGFMEGVQKIMNELDDLGEYLFPNIRRWAYGDPKKNQFNYQAEAEAANRSLWAWYKVRSKMKDPEGLLAKLAELWENIKGAWKKAGDAKAPTIEPESLWDPRHITEWINRLLIRLFAPGRSGAAAGEDEKKQFKPQFVALEDMYKRLAEQTAGGKNIPKRQLQTQISLERILKQFFNLSKSTAVDISQMLNKLINKNNVGYLGKP